ncbi:hypothetical protein JB92DRAFT_2923141 [Gautieria morchelliformis]|nr:hypothetical protein JB92DRAFT_2923141 [Gautieria morchelliformis]
MAFLGSWKTCGVFSIARLIFASSTRIARWQTRSRLLTPMAFSAFPDRAPGPQWTRTTLLARTLRKRTSHR